MAECLLMNERIASFGRAVELACDNTALLGKQIQHQLKKEIPAKILLRRAKDVVLLTGETGTGKEKIAHTIHEAAKMGLKRPGKLVQVNCANLGNGLFESELFGYRRGAYTGADRDHDGLVDRAEHGTLVLDEIQTLSNVDQARLLRFLGEREYRAVGATKTRSSDALVILSTNCDLHERIQAGTFRRDVLDRALAKIAVPSLFEHRRDVGELAQAFAMEAAEELEVCDFHGLTRRARSHLETAVVSACEVSVRRLREVVRNTVFLLAADKLPDAIESDMLLPILHTEFGFQENMCDVLDHQEVEQDFDLAVSHACLRELAERHHVSLKTLAKMSRAIETVIAEMEDKPRSYRNVVERTNRLTKVALWLVSRANTQAEFRRFFGQFDVDMPTKSVAHQIFHEVFQQQEPST